MRTEIKHAIRTMIVTLGLSVSMVYSASALTYTIGGTVSELSTSAKVVLLNKSGDALTVTANGAFKFSNVDVTGTTYDVTVGTQPTGETCTVTDGSGTVGTANVTNIVVTCKVNTYTIGGTVSGLSTSAKLVLLNKSGDALTVTANGAFKFSNVDVTGTTYDVTVGTQPTGETCTVTDGSGTVGTINVTTVVIACKVNTYTIGGTLSGLSSVAKVILVNNGGDDLTLTANGTFKFSDVDITGNTYDVAIGAIVVSGPTFETCNVTDGSGTVGTANVTDIVVNCKVPPTYTVGGAVSGLNTLAKVILLNNGSDNLTITADGAFKFSNLDITGNTYDVTVGTQPTGETCNVTDGSGTVGTANVTNIVVACKSSGLTAGGFWIPYTAAPVPTTIGGKTGLMIVPSNSLESAPAPHFVSTTQSQILAIAVQDTFVDGLLTYTPALMMFSAVGSDGNTRVYGLDLTNTGVYPTPVQISSLSLPASQQICVSDQVENELSEPTTLFAVLQIAAVGECFSGVFTHEEVSYEQSSTSAPTVVDISTDLLFNPINAIYKVGFLQGMVLFDPTTKALNLYTNVDFATPPKVLISDISNAASIGALPVKDNSSYGSEPIFVSVLNTSGTYSQYRIDPSSLTATQFHTGVVGNATEDDNNLYFEDVTSTTETVLYQESLSGGTPKALYTGKYSPDESGYQLIGSNDSELVFQFYSGADPVTAIASILSVPVGVTSTSPKTIGGPYTGVLSSAFMASPSANDTEGNLVFVTLRSQSSAGKVTYSSTEMPPAGPANPLVANSAYESFGLLTSELTATVWKVAGITETTGGWGGGTLNQVDVSTLKATPFTTTGGKDYVVPVGYLGFMEGLDSNTIGVGTLSYEQSADPTAPYIGVAVDLTRNFLLPIGFSNTNVSAF